MKLLLKYKAFSLVETVVTLAVFAILMTMLSQVLIMNWRINRIVTERSRFREEFSQLTGLIQRDFRNADFIDLDACGEDIVYPSINNNKVCKINVIEDYWWYLCEGYICKDKGDKELIYKSSAILKIEDLSIELIAENNENLTIYITVKASARNENWKINNQVRQIVVNTRNY
jgi:prepilin-type N-terminal cleavage/methylation domain-containing protein